MQSTGQTSTQAVSLVSIHGSVMMNGIRSFSVRGLSVSAFARAPSGRRVDWLRESRSYRKPRRFASPRGASCGALDELHFANAHGGTLDHTAAVFRSWYARLRLGPVSMLRRFRLRFAS